MKPGKIVLISGPSGVGKGSVREILMKKNIFDLNYSISMTTRKPRKNEKNGVEYFFVSKETFQENIRDNNFIEWEEFSGNYYGTPLNFIKKSLQEGKNILIELETKGAKKIINEFKDVISIFLKPPSMEELRNRIYKRGENTKSQEDERIMIAKKEVTEANNYKHVLINDNLELTVKNINSILERYL